MTSGNGWSFAMVFGNKNELDVLLASKQLPSQEKNDEFATWRSEMSSKWTVNIQ